MSQSQNSIGERLTAYHSFDERAIERATRVGEQSARFKNYKEFLAHYNVPDPEEVIVGDYALKVLDLRPKEHDESFAHVLHLPMANGLTPDKIVRAVSLYAADPAQRLITIGNPGIPLRDYHGKVRTQQIPAIFRGDLSIFREMRLGYLASRGITRTIQLGYSYGAELAAVMAQSNTLDTRAEHAVLAEPASVQPRSLLRLAHDFNRASPRIKRYVAAATTPLYADVRDWHENPLVVAGALLRPTNIAIAGAISRGKLEENINGILCSPDLTSVHVLWGSESELATDALLTEMMKRLQARAHPGQLKATRLKDQTHGMADDIPLHTALMLHGIYTRPS